MAPDEFPLQLVLANVEAGSAVGDGDKKVLVEPEPELEHVAGDVSPTQ